MDGIRLNVAKTTHLCDMLKQSPLSYDDLVLISGVSKPAVTNWIKKMRAAGLVRIHSFAKDVRGRSIVIEFAWGSEPDAPRPGSSDTAKLRMQKMRAKRKTDAQTR